MFAVPCPHVLVILASDPARRPWAGPVGSRHAARRGVHRTPRPALGHRRDGRARSARPPCARCTQRPAWGRTTFFFRHGFSAWWASTWRTVSRPTSATIPRRLALRGGHADRPPRITSGRRPTDHRDNRRLLAAYPAVWAASAEDRRSGPPARRARDTASRRAVLRDDTCRRPLRRRRAAIDCAGAPGSGCASTCAPTPRAHRASAWRGSGDPWHSTGGRESADVWMRISSIVLDHNCRSVASKWITTVRSGH